MDDALLPNGGDDLTKNAIRPMHATHSNTFGGVNNIAHPGGAKAAALAHNDDDDIFIPISNVGHAIQSLNRGNIVNHWGHYVHDEHRSPYASHLYDKPKQVLEEQQAKYLTKMNTIRSEWGAWDFQDPSFAGDKANKQQQQQQQRPFADFSNVPYKDMNNHQFPTGSWQTDEAYVLAFITEAKALLHRVTEGIYAEYGAPYSNKQKGELTKEQQQKRDEQWKIHIVDSTTSNVRVDSASTIKTGGVARLSKVAFDGLQRKLLHAMITHDEFYVVLGGHSAAAGHGNNFQQNRIITFHRLMEPVMDKLGVKLISRNMGMGGVGTLQFTLAGGDYYGEMDIVEWDSGMTEKGPPVDLFNKQAILSGERLPLIMSDFHFNVMAETNNTAMMGSYINDITMMPETTWETANSIPYAARWIRETEKDLKYNAICWEPRKDFIPTKAQNNHPGSQVSWHPGFRIHQWQGRRLALVLLKALNAALDQWENAIFQKQKSWDGSSRIIPLPEEADWHVGQRYEQTRNYLRTYISTPSKNNDEILDIRSDCEKLIPWIPRICRLQMHGYGMWTPRAHNNYNLLNIIEKAPNGYKPYFKKQNIYHGFDLLPYEQQIPDGEIDVHAIAIVTTNPPPDDLDHSFQDHEEYYTKNNSVTKTESIYSATTTTTTTSNSNPPPPTRRWLVEASMRAYQRGIMGDDGDGDDDYDYDEDRISAATATSSTFTNTIGETNYNVGKHSNNSTIVKPDRQYSSSQNENESLSYVRKLESSAASTANNDNDNEMIIPGRGWEAHAWTPVNGFCDGSAQSECKREESAECLLYGASDNHMDVHGNALSGWLVINVPYVKEGIILIRMEWWCGQNNDNPLTNQWTEVNGGKTTDTTPWNISSDNTDRRRRRSLKPTPDQLIPSDFEMDYYNNYTKVIQTMKRDEWIKYIREYVKNVAVWPMLNEETFAKDNHLEENDKGIPIQIAIRFRTKLMPHQSYCISHVYFA